MHSLPVGPLKHIGAFVNILKVDVTIEHAQHSLRSCIITTFFLQMLQQFIFPEKIQFVNICTCHSRYLRIVFLSVALNWMKGLLSVSTAGHAVAHPEWAWACPLHGLLPCPPAASWVGQRGRGSQERGSSHACALSSRFWRNQRPVNLVTHELVN